MQRLAAKYIFMGESARFRAVVYGTVATPIGDATKADVASECTHSWTVYVRGFHDEDISAYVKRVIFKLHDSFPNPVRAVDTPPFEVSESGWGEFAIQIKIVFQDQLQRPLTFTHQLRLYPFDPVTGNAHPMDPDAEPSPESVVAENYEEIIFDPASDRMAAILDASDQARYTDLTTSPRYKAYQGLEEEELQRIDAAIAQVKAQIEEIAKPPESQMQVDSLAPRNRTRK